MYTGVKSYEFAELFIVVKNHESWMLSNGKDQDGDTKHTFRRNLKVCGNREYMKFVCNIH